MQWAFAISEFKSEKQIRVLRNIDRTLIGHLLTLRNFESKQIYTIMAMVSGPLSQNCYSLLTFFPISLRTICCAESGLQNWCLFRHLTSVQQANFGLIKAGFNSECSTILFLLYSHLNKRLTEAYCNTRVKYLKASIDSYPTNLVQSFSLKTSGHGN